MPRISALLNADHARPNNPLLIFCDVGLDQTSDFEWNTLGARIYWRRAVQTCANAQTDRQTLIDDFPYIGIRKEASCAATVCSICSH